MNLEKFRGVIPAFYACYDEQGNVSEEATKELGNHLYNKKVKGLYVGGSSGECIYQTLEERKETLRIVAENLRGKLTLIAHVGAPSTRDSVILAQYAAELGYDALSAIPPIYFKLPENSVYNYWSKIMDATDLPFIIYNIPQTTGFDLSISLLQKLRNNPKVIGVKNSSMPVMDIERFKAAAGENFIVFNGPDEQFVAGRLIGADGAIGGTYGVMPELFLYADEFVKTNDFVHAREIQTKINDIIISLCSLEGSMYAAIKAILALQGVSIGGVREPLENIHEGDLEAIHQIKNQIDEAIAHYGKVLA
ncbi:dihydrodipicolinate synthase family protein [Kurthia gibsonii]|uniref:Dihydrodipicolinate synthase family protein n=1 Tax=Kurthia gibsonii TaxID=33946 RepID=A0ABU9LPN9_9BACL